MNTRSRNAGRPTEPTGSTRVTRSNSRRQTTHESTEPRINTMTRKPKSSVTRLLIIGIVFHVVYSWSIFDIYFRSPLVHGMEPVDPPTPAPARRLVLLVADGLRADKLYEDDMTRAPHLRTKVHDQGTWGVSHTRVPTESRPGHVALIAGFYEDVSAVTKGWKMNPVNFDSVLNESRHTWSFGSPDILPMFAYGSSDTGKIDMVMYEADNEDFAKDDASLLDTWVFDRVDELLDRAKTNATLASLLHADRVVFFLHLLGLDTNGHGHKPYSREYYENIKLVDAGVRRVEQRFAEFYGNDGKTAFVFTADHGMGNRGAHGDGHPDNTQTPIVAWGAGVAKPNTTHPTGHDALSISWQLDNVQRNDVNQADIAPLMSTLIGVPFPLNSVGVLPIQYLDNTDEYKARAVYANSRQILAQYLVKTRDKRRTELVFKPFGPLTRHAHITTHIESLITTGAFEEAEKQSTLLIQTCIDGLRYYQTYDWLFLRSIISVGYIGWIVYSTIFIIKTYVLETVSQSFSDASSNVITSANAIGAVVFVGVSVLLFFKNSPVAYYLYVAFPVYFWVESFKQRDVVAAVTRAPWSATNMSIVGSIALYVISLEVLVYTYFRREVLTACLIVAGVVWPMTMPKGFLDRHGSLVVVWRIATLATSVFTLLPVEVDEDVRLVILGGILIVVSGIAALYLIPRYTMSSLPVANTPQTSETKPKSMSMSIVPIQLLVLVLSFIVIYTTSKSLEAKTGLPPLNAIISWCILAFCALVPILDGVSGSHHYLNRLVVIYLSFAPVFVLLSVCYEALFYFCFSMTILVWMVLEKQLYNDTTGMHRGDSYAETVTATRSGVTQTGQDGHADVYRPLRIADMRIASMFLLFINVAFFGTGNIASVSSFSLECVYRFTTVFNPFLMGSLLILKILIPFFLLSSVFSILSRSLGLSGFSLFLLVLSTTDIMTLNFFFLVRDDGSWLEIGTTISHFIIASAFIVFQIVLFCVSHVLVGRVLVPRGVSVNKNK